MKKEIFYGKLLDSTSAAIVSCSFIYVSSYKCSTFSASIRITSRVNIVKKTKRQTTQVVAVTVVLVVVGGGSVTGIVSNRVDVVNHVRQNEGCIRRDPFRKKKKKRWIVC